MAGFGRRPDGVRKRRADRARHLFQLITSLPVINQSTFFDTDGGLMRKLAVHGTDQVYPKVDG